MHYVKHVYRMSFITELLQPRRKSVMKTCDKHISRTYTSSKFKIKEDCRALVGWFGFHSYWPIKGHPLQKFNNKPFRSGYKANRYSDVAEIQYETSLRIVNQPSWLLAKFN